MFNAQMLRLFRLVCAGATIVAMVAQLIYGARNYPTFDAWNFFSYFTIQSNSFAAAMLILLATSWSTDRSEIQTLIRGGVVACLAAAGVVYGILLSGYSEGVQTVLPWVDTIVHKFIPLVMVVDWLIDRPHNRLELRKCLVWLVYPALYLVYSLIRGSIVDWYPYPFLDPDEVGGYAGVAVYSVGIAVGFIAFVWLIVTLGNRPWESEQKVAVA